MIAAMAVAFPDGILAVLGGCLDATDSIVALYDRDDLLRYANAAYEQRFLRGLEIPVSQ